MKILDNFLPARQFAELQNTIMARGFPWFYVETVSLPSEDQHFIKDKMAKETDGFYHILYDREQNITSFADPALENFYQAVERQLGYTKNHLIRSRLSLKMPKIGFTTENYNLPHVDYYFEHDTIIYYINDCDGDTRFFNEYYIKDEEEITKFSVKEMITPKANRLVIFNGLQYHTASNPFNFSRRIVININYEKL